MREYDQRASSSGLRSRDLNNALPNVSSVPPKSSARPNNNLSANSLLPFDQPSRFPSPRPSLHASPPDPLPPVARRLPAKEACNCLTFAERTGGLIQKQ